MNRKIKEENNSKIISNIKLENILCLFVIMCPILDMGSFLFRNAFNTNFSPSTIIRPIIPTVISLYLFIKKDKKFKLYSFLISIIYGIYGIIHLFLFTKVKTEFSYSNVFHEMQYIVNYSFMILNLFLYTYIFKIYNIEKLKKSIIVSIGIYILLIFISILTGTSSNTYEEGMGYKGWFESGNSISSILLLSMFIYLPYIKDKKHRKIIISILVLVGIFLSLLIGTRAGLFGFSLITAIYICIEVIYNLIKNKKINKKIIYIGLGSLLIISLIVLRFGSNTIQRRRHLEEIESNIVDKSRQENSHITGDLLEIKEKIENGKIEENYMSEEQKKSVLDLYNIANDLKIKNNDQRMQQLIYNLALIKNQKNIILVLFGNGYMANFRELVFEMEVPAILCNFGILGFILYLGPFITILFKGIYVAIKNRKKIDDDYIFLLLGSAFAFALSFFSGYTFFNSSTMMIIIVLNTVLYNKIQKIDKKKMENKYLLQVNDKKENEKEKIENK